MRNTGRQGKRTAEMDISYEESLKLDNPIYLDVRSPLEFGQDHIPGAVNIPLFDNDERKEVGTLYKITGRDEAIIRGTEIVGGKLSEIVGEIISYSSKDIVVSCARGGMRSSSVASLIESLGMKVYRLEKGYKGYRKFIHDKMEDLKIAPPLFVLQGLTGSGKTEIISHIENSIDLEGMAGHRSSIFGAIGLKQNTQKFFETLLFHKIIELRKSPWCIIEGESQKIGNLHIPPSIFTQMRNSPVILIRTDIEKRIDIIEKEYTEDLDREKVRLIVRTLNSRLGAKIVEELEELLMAGNIREFIKILLVKYYDPLYSHTIDRMSFIKTINNTDSKTAAEEIISLMKSFNG